MSVERGPPGKGVARDESLHPVPLETLGNQGWRQIPKPRIAERGENLCNDDARVVPTAFQSSRAHLTEHDHALPGSKGASSSTRLLDGVAGRLQHGAGQRSGPQVARDVEQHESHAAGREQSGGMLDREEPSGAVEGHREHSPVAERARGLPIIGSHGVQPHMDHGALPRLDKGGERLLRAEHRLDEGDRGLREACFRRGPKGQLIDWEGA